MLAISYQRTAGTARIHTENKFMRPVCLSLWYQFGSICMDCFFNIYHTSDGQDTRIFSENGTFINRSEWYNIAVDVNGISPFKIFLEAVFNDNKSEVPEAILVDDTLITYRPCKGKYKYNSSIRLSGLD